MVQEDIRKILEEAAEKDYQEFSSLLIPGIHNILGIRFGKLRGIAKEIAKKDWQACMAWNDKKYFEETILQAMVLGYAKADIKELLSALAGFIPEIDNWSVNDTLCSSFKAARQYQEETWDFLMGYRDSTKEYEARFIAVMSRAYFLNDTYINKVLETLAVLYTGRYYASTGVAWALASAWADYPARTKEFLEIHQADFDKGTYMGALQKCIESYRISREDKEYIKQVRMKLKT